MPAQNSGGGNTGPYFDLFLDTFQQNVNWNAAVDPPLLSPFTLSIFRSNIYFSRIEWEIVYGQLQVDWLNLTGSSVSGNEITVGTTTQKTLLPVFVDIDTLEDGTYSAEIYFNAYGGTILYSTTSYNVSLEIVNSSVANIQVEQQEYHVLFNRQTGILSGETTVNILNNTNPELLNFQALYFVPKTDVTTTFTLENFDIGTNSTLPQEGFLDITGKLLKGLNVIETFNIALSIVNSSDIICNKTNLDFTIYKTNAQTASANFTLTNPENKNFTITAPSWLILSESSGNTSKTINVTTVNSTVINGGIYTGEIVVSYDSNTIVIAVQLQVISFINFVPLPNNRFCLDQPSMIFAKMNDESKSVRITLKARYTVMGTVINKENVYLIPYNNGEASFDVGAKLHDLFPRYKKNYFEVNNETEIYKSIEFSVFAEELNAKYEVKYVETSNVYKFFPGKKSIGFPLLSEYIFRKKNKFSIFINAEVVGDSVILRKIQDANDVFSLDFQGTEFKYYNLPRNYNLMHLHVENGNYAPEWFSLTGEFKITNDVSHIYAKNIFEAQNEKFDVTKAKTLSVNTGHFLKNEIDLINDIVEKKLCFIKLGEKIYRCFSTTQKLILEDSTEELLDRDLEFLIVE